MVMHVQHVDGEYRIVLPQEAVEAMHLAEGTAVEVELAVAAEHRYVTMEEGMEAFRSTIHLHDQTYSELAK